MSFFIEVEHAIGKIVYKHHKKKNNSQTKLAIKIHLVSSNIGRIERSKSTPTFYTLIFKSWKKIGDYYN